MKKLKAALLVVLCSGVLAVAQSSPGGKPKVFIAPMHDGFASALTAAMFKKKVPVTLVLKPGESEYQIHCALTDQHGKPLAQALAFGLGGIGGFFIGRGSLTASVTVTVGDSVVYAYTAHKKGAGAIQKAAESFAKNFKKWLKRRRKKGRR